jgi:hypothetical protein
MTIQARAVRVGLDGHLDEPGVHEECRRVLRSIQLDLVEVVLRNFRNFLKAMGEEKSADSSPVRISVDHAPTESRDARLLCPPAPAATRHDAVCIVHHKIAVAMLFEEGGEPRLLVGSEKGGSVRTENRKARVPRLPRCSVGCVAIRVLAMLARHAWKWLYVRARCSQKAQTSAQCDGMDAVLVNICGDHDVKIAAPALGRRKTGATT